MQGHVFLGKYTVNRLLDEGGMSKIFLAHQTNPNRDVVVKLLKEQLRVKHKALEHFRREIHIMSKVQHPNAVAYYDSIPNDPMGPVLIMEYVRGTDLGMLMYRQGKFPPDRVGRILGQLCSVLNHVHQDGIVHRDVKPANVMIVHPGTPQETVKLMDWGLAKMSSMLYIAPEDVLSRDASVASGTPEYIAPEQIRGNDIDGRADIYSVGIVLYEMLTGKRPFISTSTTELMRCHLDEEPPTFRTLGIGEEIPFAIEDVVRSCLAKAPEERPRSAEELALQYEQALGKRILPIRSTSGTPPSATPAPTPNGKTPRPTVPPPTKRLSIRDILQHSVEAVMPEAMAMIKLKGFIHDLGGEVIESVPGMIKVRLGSSTPEQKKSGLFGWLDKGAAKQGIMDPTSTAVLELRMERRDPSHPNNLTITLVIVPGRGLVTSQWQNRCKKIGMDLKAYLMGR
jgi:serine/threonine-protein kinase